MAFKIIRTDKANDHLHNIINYIADDSGNVDIALKYLGELENAILRLAEYPYSGSYPRYSILKNQGYRVLIVGQYLVFYKVYEDDKLVVIYAVLNGRQAYWNLL